MNFTPFGTAYTSSSLAPAGTTTAQFTTAKFATATQVGGGGGGTGGGGGGGGASAGGQVVGLLSADEAGVTYLRPVDANGFTLNLAGQAGNADGAPQFSCPQIITLPISVPGSKPGELPQQQTLQIQVVNPGGGAAGEKYALPISLQPFQQGGATVLTLSYANPHQDNGEPIQLQLQTTDGEGDGSNNNNNTNSPANSGEASSQTMHSEEIQHTQRIDGGWDAQVNIKTEENTQTSQEDAASGTQQAFPVALVAHLPSDLILRDETITADKDESEKDKGEKSGEQVHFNLEGVEMASVAAAAGQWQSLSVPANAAVADYLSRLPSSTLPLSLHHFLKFSAETIKRESAIESSPLNADEQGNAEEVQHHLLLTGVGGEVTDPKTGKKKKKYKKKPPKPRRPRPGQVHIAVALDGTTLFCCPECNMAYPDKEMLEQHLVAHKIERRFICDICGAGLKRKEHLERHKLGHNPERPYICSVCCKGFKRKEHLNLHFVIHSGEKSEVCPECGKGFHRKDHLRKHARSHLTKRIKEEVVQQHQSVVDDGTVTMAVAAVNASEAIQQPMITTMSQGVQAHAAVQVQIQPPPQPQAIVQPQQQHQGQQTQQQHQGQQTQQQHQGQQTQQQQQPQPQPVQQQHQSAQTQTIVGGVVDHGEPSIILHHQHQQAPH